MIISHDKFIKYTKDDNDFLINCSKIARVEHFPAKKKGDDDRIYLYFYLGDGDIRIIGRPDIWKLLVQVLPIIEANHEP